MQAGGWGRLHLAGHPTQQPRPSRGENRIALGQFRSQRHRGFNRTVSARGCKARLRRRLANVDAVIAVLRRLVLH